MEYVRETLDHLFGEYGSPLYIFDENGFIENYISLDTAMKEKYEYYCASYSFKTNYTPYICRTVKTLGGYAEVVSGMEYMIAKKVGFEDGMIIFNGPDKGKDGIEAFLNGCIINVDSLDELNCFCTVAEQNKKKEFRLGLRLNLDIGQDFISRFGMDENDIAKAIQIVSRVKNLRISGLHFHISRCRGIEAWKKRTEKILELSASLFQDELDYIDLGSGMFSSMEPELAAQFETVPTYREYAEVTAGLVSEHYQSEKKPILFTEPGTTLVNRYVDFAAEIVAIKSVKGRDIAVLNCSQQNLGEICTLKNLPVRVVPGREPQEFYDRIDLTGYTCLEQDVILPAFRGRLAVGDYVVFGNTGGYSNVLKPPFIRPNCAMIAKTKAGQFKLMKCAETYEDVLHTYDFN